jgi:hypothetical protein
MTMQWAFADDNIVEIDAATGDLTAVVCATFIPVGLGCAQGLNED